MVANRLNTTQKQEGDDHDENETQSSGWVITPISAM
jgi:hypothetical protein